MATSFFSLVIFALVVAVQAFRASQVHRKMVKPFANSFDEEPLGESSIDFPGARIFRNGTAEQEAVELAMEAEMADFPPSCRKFVQWTVEEDHEKNHSHDRRDDHGDSSLRLDDVAIGLISGRPQFFDVVHRNILRYAARGQLIRARGACPCSFRAALGVLRDRHPDAEWYYVGDEDAIIDLDGLVRLLGRYDPAVPTLISSATLNGICENCGSCPEVRDQHGRAGDTFYGGNGQIFSRGLVGAIAPGLKGPCGEAVAPTLRSFGDIESACALAGWWQPSWRFVRLQRRPNTWRHFEARRPSFVVAHHLCPEMLERLPHVNQGQSVRHPELVSVDNAPNDGCAGPGK